MAFVTIKDKDNVTLGHLQTDAQERLGVHNLLHAQNRKDAGVAGGVCTSGAWRTRELNTVVINNITGASLSASNQIILPAGEYWVEAFASTYDTSETKIRLRSISESTTKLSGIPVYAYGGAGSSIMCQVSGKIIVTNEDIIELQQRSVKTSGTWGLGIPTNWDSEYNVFADLKIWKVA